MIENQVTEFDMSARFFPHHPHFLSAEKSWGGVNYTFRAFTGNEPKPQHVEFPKPYEREEDQTADYKAMWAEYVERNSEIDAARKLWETARYHRQITPLVEAAVKARPPVDEALAAMTTAWEELDNALVWPVAVKHLLDAQDNARAALARWVTDHAYPLAEAEGTQSYYIREQVADWREIAAELNGGHRVDWGVGWYHAGDRAGYSDSPLDDLNEEIKRQRARLAEIAQYSGERAH